MSKIQGRKEFLVALLLLSSVLAFFFHKTFIYGYTPFPGDLLIAEYKPWSTYSYLGYNPGTYPSKLQYFDVIRQIHPWKTLVTDQLVRGEFPLWNPYNFSGSPLLTNFQSAVFYPLNFLYFLFSQASTFTILVILQPLLASFFAYLYARKIGISPIGSILASLAFSYALFMTVFLEYNTIGHTILWLPLLLYLIEKLIEKPTFIAIIFFVLSLVASFFAGHLQIFGFVLGFIFIYGVSRILTKFRSRSQRIKYSLGFLLLFILTLGIGSVQLFSTLELINLSARVPQEYKFLVEKLLIQPRELILFLSPDFFGNPAVRNYLLSDSYPGNAIYIGLIPFILSFFSLASFKKNQFVRLFSVFSLLLLLFFLRWPGTELFYKLNIPFLSTGSPTNAIFLLSFCLAVLSGFAIDGWIKKEYKSLHWILGFFSLVFLVIWTYIILLHPTISTKNFIYSTAVFILFIVLFFVAKLFKRKTVVAALFLIVTIFDLFYFFQKFNPFVPRQLVFPDASIFNFLKEKAEIDRFWGYGSAAIEANFATQYSLFSPDGYDPLYPRRYGELIQSSLNGKIHTEFTNQTRSDAKIAGGFGEEDLPSNQYRLKILDLLGVKYILDRVENGSSEKTFPGDRFRLIYEKDGWRMFENLKSAPRAFLTSDYEVFRSKEEFEKLFFHPEFDVRKMILLEDKSIEKLGGGRGEVKLISYTPNRMVFDTKSENPQLLFLSDTYYPGWRSFVDNNESKILRANYAFRAVVVPGGKHRVVFEYKPEPFYLGAKVSIISLVILAPIAYFASRRVKYLE